MHVLAAVAVFAAFARPDSGVAAPASAFDRLSATWSQLHDYSVTIEGHEVLGDRSADDTLRYAFRKPDRARMDVIGGSNRGTTVLWTGSDSIVGYRRGLSFFKKHGNIGDVGLTSLRGNGVRMPDLGDIVACFGGNRGALVQREGPVIRTEATDEIELPYTDVNCPDDSMTDRAITRDVVDISKRTGLILRRMRFEGKVAVEHWELSDYEVNTGLDDRTFR